MKTRAHLFISGRVQGVFFRATTKRKADSLGVKGWARNLPGGDLEAVFEGEEPAVKDIVEFCRHGPSGAVVTNLSLNWEEYLGEFEKFTVL